MFLKRNFLIFIIVIMASAGLFVFWLKTLKNLNNLKNENIKMAAKLLSAEKQISDIKNLEVLFNSLTEEQEEIRRNIITGRDELVKFIENLEFLAATAGAEMEIKSVRVPENQADLSPIFNIELQGSFSDIFYFVEMFENLPYFISFQNVAVKSGREWEAKIDFTLLSYKP